MDKNDIVAETQVVVLMGGLGTRLGLKDRPKAMADVHGIPFFDYELKLLKRWGFHKFLFLVGHQADAVKEYYGDGSSRQMKISYSHDGPVQLGTGGALYQAMELLEDDFLLLYGDSFMDLDYQEVVYRYHMGKAAGKWGLMTLLHNENQYDRSNVVYKNQELLLYDKKHPVSEMHYIDYGVSMLSKRVLEGAVAGEAFDLADRLTLLSKEGKLAGQTVTKRFYEIGTPKSYKEFCDYAKRRFGELRPAVFLDRDGVINELCFCEESGQLDSPFIPADFQYKEGILECLRFVQEQGFYLFIVTNQPAAAKGKVALTRLYDLNTWMIKDLREKGIYVDALCMCPHHPQGAGHTKETFLIRTCGCRKPGEAMITGLADIYGIDMEASYMLGDSYTDIIAGQRAGVKTVMLGSLKCDACQRMQGNKPDYLVERPGDLKGIIMKEKQIKRRKEMDKRYIENYLNETKWIADNLDTGEISQCVEILRDTKKAGGRLFVLGVGGSAANASHAVNDFRKIGGLETYAPTDNAAELTARTNDEGWDTTFSEWLETSRISQKDTVLVLSVGGGSEHTSRNIVRALELTKERGGRILSIVSRDGGYSKKVSDACILVPEASKERITPHAEGWQGVLWHLLVNAMIQ